jgi:outer membrane protein OmpA-like peptidoglycan-associated protein
MKPLIYLLLFIILATQTLLPAEAQVFKKAEKSSSGKKAKSNPSAWQKAETLIIPSLNFQNISLIPYFKDERMLDMIEKFKREKDWENLLPALTEYVRNFGVENFILEIDYIWDLGKLAKHLGKNELAKEAFRLVLKHHRDTLESGKLRYDTLLLDKSTKALPLKKYLELLDTWQLADSLKPDDDMLKDLGDSINSPDYEDYGITIMGNDSVIFFTSNRVPMPSKSEIPDYAAKPNENIYYARRLPDGTWTEAKEVESVNTSYHEGSPCVSPDGKIMIFSRCYAPSSFGNCDLFMAFWDEKNKVWGAAYNMGAGINSEGWDSHPAFSPTGDTLFFVSDRKGGFGGMDIYYAIKADKKGMKWFSAKNIGPVINTMRNEASPYLHPASGVFYFSSDGQLVNLGSFDIYKSYPISENIWSEPKNLGPFVNTDGSEFYFTIDRQLKKIYYAMAKREKKNSMNLFSFPMPMSAMPYALVRFTGKVFEKSSGETFEGIVALFDLEHKTPIEPKKIKPDGTFEFELINKRKYLLVVSGENFFRLEEIFYLDGDISKEITVQNIHAVQFKSIEFESGSSKLTEEMENDLHLLIQFLNDHPDFELDISGHTDGDGSADFNLKLSQARADALKNYIVSYGKISDSRINAVGYGASKPLIFPEISPEDKRTNRRVEFKLKKPEAVKVITDDTPYKEVKYDFIAPASLEEGTEDDGGGR